MLEVLDGMTFPLDTLFRKSCCGEMSSFRLRAQFEASSTRRVHSYHACVGGWMRSGLQKPTGPSAPLTLFTKIRILFVHVEMIAI